MRWPEVQQRLLPKSSVAVVAPWLVIAPAGNPVVRLDLRLLDRVQRRPGAKGARRCEVVLRCGELDVALYIADGPEAAARIINAAAPLTRSGSRNKQAPRKRLSEAVASPATTGPAGFATLIAISSTPNAEPAPNDELAGKVFELSSAQTSIGRSEHNDIVLEHVSVSATHAKVTRDPSTGRYRINDLQSANGVRVNGERQRSVELEDGDIVDLGHLRTRFESREDIAFGEDAPPSLDRFLIVGNDPVLHRDSFIQVGPCAFRVNEVNEYALHGANLPLPKNRLLQAAIAMLVVAAGEVAVEARLPRARRPGRRRPRRATRARLASRRSRGRRRARARPRGLGLSARQQGGRVVQMRMSR